MRTRLFVYGVIVAVVVIGSIVLQVWGSHRGTTTQLVQASASPLEAATAAATPTAGAQSAGTAPASASPGAAQASPGEAGAASESPSPEGSAAESAQPGPSLVPSPTPTIPTPPPGLPPGWEQQSERTENGPEAELVVRTGSIDNLGFGWPAHFTPFSGESTPVHAWICSPRPGAAPGTDRNMLGTGVTQHDLDTLPSDGYSHCDTRPENLPQAIALQVGDLPADTKRVFFQIFLDDFQPLSFHSHFQVSLNGTRIPSFEDTINQLDQTGPIGKLVTLPLLPEYFPILRQGTVNLYIDDPTTGAPDGYAIDFVRILVNPKPFKYNVTVKATVVDAATQKPIRGATVSAAEVAQATSGDGTATLRGVPAGLVSVGASAVGYDSAVQLLDLPAGQTGNAQFQLHRHKETINDLKAQVEKSGTVAIYGIHFDTASAKLRPDSIASLNAILQLVNGEPNSKWIIAGHTDNQGGAGYNMQLSDARAHSVVAWLEQHGVAANRLTAKGYGLTRPVADNATENGRALNRRVEVSLVR